MITVELTVANTHTGFVRNNSWRRFFSSPQKAKKYASAWASYNSLSEPIWTTHRDGKQFVGSSKANEASHTVSYEINVHHVYHLHKALKKLMENR